jgi:hypothetical protein
MIWSWWYYPQAITAVEDDDNLYWGYATNEGYCGVARYDKASGVTTKTDLKRAIHVDDHNGLALTIMEDGRIMCVYSGGHNNDNEVHIRISDKPYDITNFSTDIVLMSAGKTCYGQILQHNGRYYMIYSAPGTQYRSYCMAAYYSDEGPLTGFKLQKNNPFCEHRRGVVSGAGHGCVQHGPDNTLWAFYTITSCATHPNERRIGMDRVWVNEDGELCCRVTDTPQLAYCDHQGTDCDSGLLPVNVMLRDRCRASSYENGRNAVYAIDESLITWWQPKEDDKEPYLMLRLDTDYTCEASRIIWRDVNMNVDAGILPGAFRYVIETRPNIGEGEWTTVLDMSENTDDLNVDYKAFPPTICREVRLRIVGSPRGITPGVAEFTLFGRSVRL